MNQPAVLTTNVERPLGGGSGGRPVRLACGRGRGAAGGGQRDSNRLLAQVTNGCMFTNCRPLLSGFPAWPARQQPASLVC